MLKIIVTVQMIILTVGQDVKGGSISAIGCRTRWGTDKPITYLILYDKQNISIKYGDLICTEHVNVSILCYIYKYSVS